MQHRTRAQKETLDFFGLFGENVMPTAHRTLECDGRLLVIKHYGERDGIVRSHDRIWRALARRGTGITVVCLWGNAHVPEFDVFGTRRWAVVYQDGEQLERVETDDATIRTVLLRWWTGNGDLRFD